MVCSFHHYPGFIISDVSMLDGWAFILSFVAPMWSLTGCVCARPPHVVHLLMRIPLDDSAAHISEEVTGAARAAPIAILVSVAAVSGMGWILIIAASFATTSVPELLGTDLELPMGQLLLDVLGKHGMLAIWGLIIGAQVSPSSMFAVRRKAHALRHFLCRAAQGVDASRVVFAFARDNALPGSRWWRRMDARTRTPVNAVWLVMGLSALCGLLGFSATAFSSLAGCALCISSLREKC